MMAENTNQGGLSSFGVDPLKAPLYGEGTDEYMQTIQKAQEDAIKALQDRYAKPNWFKVAAGFAKPQLGGFLASLGSASDALGENIEQERAQQFPIQQLKMQMAQTGALMKNTVTVNDEINRWTKAHPNELPTNEQLQNWEARAPDSKGVLSLRAQKRDYFDKMGVTQKSQDLVTQQQNLAIQKNQLKMQGIDAERRILEQNYQSGVIKDPAVYNERRLKLDQRAQALASEPLPVPSVDEPPSNAADVQKKKNLNQAEIPENDLDKQPPVSAGKVVPKADTSQKKSGMSGKNPQLTPSAENQQPTVEYKHVVQQPRPSGEPTSVYEGKVKSAEKIATVEEERTNKAIDPYYLSNEPRIASSYDNALKDIKSIAESKDPEIQKAYADLHNLLRKKGGPLGAAAQAGLTGSLGGYGATFKLPVDAYLAAGVDPKYHGLYDRILGNYNTLASVHAMLDGKTLDDFNKNPALWSRYAHIGKPADEAYRSINDNMFAFRMHQKIGEELPKIRARIQAEHPDELAPNTSAYRSKDVKAIIKAFDDARDIERKVHGAATQSNKPKP
jgi:hypothetical protein